MHIAFDARVWERPPHSFGRVLRLLVLAAREKGWKTEFWAEKDLRPENLPLAGRVYTGGRASSVSRADVLWSPRPDVLPCTVPSVLTLCDINPLLPDGRARVVRWMRGRRFRSHSRKGFRKAWRVATISEHARSGLSEVFPEFGAKLNVVPLFVDPALRRSGDEECRSGLESLGLEPGYILFFGALRRHKNWEGLMRAYAALPAAARNAHPLVLAGSAHRAGEKAARLAVALGVEDRVHVTGSVPDELVPVLYTGAFMFVFPSFMEGFGLPPLEAMACGVPVIATNRTAVPEVLGDAAVLIEPEDRAGITQAMERLIADPTLRGTLISEGHNRVASFNPSRTGDAMEAVLRDLPGPGGGSEPQGGLNGGVS